MILAESNVPESLLQNPSLRDNIRILKEDFKLGPVKPPSDPQNLDSGTPDIVWGPERHPPGLPKRLPKILSRNPKGKPKGKPKWLKF
jgi:hypothetical protein